MVSILRIISFIQLGDKTGEDINCIYVDPTTIVPPLIPEMPDVFVSPALWSATEVAVAIFSCSIPSLTYLFRRVLGSKQFDSATPDQNPDHTNRAAYHGGHGPTRDSSSFQRLRDDHEHFDSVALEPGNKSFAVNMVGSSHDHTNSYDMDQIVVKKEFDVEQSTSGRL